MGQISKANVWYATLWLSPDTILSIFIKHTHFLSFSFMGSSLQLARLSSYPAASCIGEIVVGL